MLSSHPSCSSPENLLSKRVWIMIQRLPTEKQDQTGVKPITTSCEMYKKQQHKNTTRTKQFQPLVLVGKQKRDDSHTPEAASGFWMNQTGSVREPLRAACCLQVPAGGFRG